ncbi:unnamed protein product [Phytophthora fragariaefolia]|uniref:Unnamed protein product n=1 Tax=Phytophthora fragariaefolia TaxID=1490495 RepID=A0A9W6XDH4_9STRA|nr:unnamed protein product [Phytophthora fragariaefolia]
MTSSGIQIGTSSITAELKNGRDILVQIQVSQSRPAISCVDQQDRPLSSSAPSAAKDRTYVYERAPRAVEDVFPNLRPHQQSRLDDEVDMGDTYSLTTHGAQAHARTGSAASSNFGAVGDPGCTNSSGIATPSQNAASGSDFVTQMMQMFMHNNRHCKLSNNKISTEPPKFQGKSSEDADLWLFRIEEHFSAYATDRDSPDSHFADMAVPVLGTAAMSCTKHQLRSLLGTCVYGLRFCNDFVSLVAPVVKLAAVERQPAVMEQANSKTLTVGYA